MITQFALRLIFGMGVMWLVMPRREVTAGFFKIQLRIVMGLSVLASLTVGHSLGGNDPEAATLLSSSSIRWICFITAAIAYVGSGLWALDRRRGGTITLFLVAGLSALALWGRCGGSTDAGAAAVLEPISEFSSALLLGSVVTGMLLGHWYLTSPTMTLQPLTVLNNWLLGAAILRLIVSAIGLGMALDSLSTTTHYAWLSLRWLAGIGAPFLIWFLVCGILKYRNTQSATGVLFSGVILIFIGEMTAVLLLADLGWPV